MKYLNTLVSLALLLSSSVSAKFVGVPIVRTPPPLVEPEESAGSELSDYGLQAGIETTDDLRLLTQLYKNAAQRSDEQASKLKELISRSDLDRLSKTNLKAALLIGKLASPRILIEVDIGDIKKIASKANRLNHETIRDLLRALRHSEKRVDLSLIDDIEKIKTKLRASLPKYRNNNDD